MICPLCKKSEEYDIVNTRKSKKNDNSILRRRQCKGCGKRFTTHEYADLDIEEMEG